MPVLQSQDFVDFSNATLDDKIDIIFELLDKQRNLARLSYENTELPLEVRTLLQFIIVICNTNLAVVLVNSKENRLYLDVEFLELYPRKLHEQISENMEVDFLVHD